MECPRWEELFCEKTLILFGQDEYLMRMRSYLTALFPKLLLQIVSYVGLRTEDKTAEISPAKVQSYLAALDCRTPILLAFAGRFQESVSQYTQKEGFLRIYYYDSVLDNFLKKDYFKQYFRERGREFKMIYECPPLRKACDRSVNVYMAQSIFDNAVSRSNADLRGITPIQVGAALTSERLGILTDDIDENISERNAKYCEMTAFYWMWRNDTVADYLGLCHYRRFWVDLDKIVEKLQTTDIDAVLPLPTLCEHSVHEDYLLKYIPKVWQPMMEVMKRRSPDYYEAAQEIFKGKIFYASNMCILRREVLDDLCEWMFPIVMEVEEIVGDIEDPYYNRYAGFCTERLITLYFLYNKHHWKIAHAEKVFIN